MAAAPPFNLVGVYIRADEPRANPLEVPSASVFCEQVARAYDQAPDYDASQAWRWGVLRDSVERLYRQVLSRVRVRFVTGQPYVNAEKMRRAVLTTGELKISTEGNDHPYFTPEENLHFRAVHDYIVHIAPGPGGPDFGTRGELRAYNLHRRMAPREAWPALFTEVAAQACYVNARGEFPIQKVAVLPFDYYRVGRVAPQSNPHAFEYWASCPQLTGPLVQYIARHERRISYRAFARQVDLGSLPGGREHPALYRASSPANWTIAFYRSRLPSGDPVYFFRWSRIEHVFVRARPDLEAETELARREPNPRPRRVVSFSSGANAPGEQVGFARAGVPPGVSILRLEKDSKTGEIKGWNWLCGGPAGARPAARRCWDSILRTSRVLKVPVFIDSGAFSELDGPTIPTKLLDQVVEHQVEAAQRLGPLALIVLPDKVGSQPATLRRLRRYKKQINAILDTGARGTVVVHRGRMSGPRFVREVAKVLGRRDFTLGFPTVRAAVEPSQIAQALDEISWHPPGVHLLGMGDRHPRLGEYLGALSGLPAGTWVSTDAVVIRRLVGRESGLKPLTEQQDIARAEIQYEAWGEVGDPLVGEGVDRTEMLPFPSDWMKPGEIQQVAKKMKREVGLAGPLWSAKEVALWRSDPTEYRHLLQDAIDEDTDDKAYTKLYLLDLWLEQAWFHAIGRMTTQLRKERAIRRTMELEAAAKARATHPAARRGQLSLGID